MQSPININSPYSKKVKVSNEDLIFEYQEIDDSYATHTGNNLKMYGNFGSVRFYNELYTASEITFFKKSEHTYGPDSKRNDLEMQIFHESTSGKKLVIVVSFNKSDNNSMFVDQLDFNNFQGMEKGDSRQINNYVDIGLVFNKAKEFIKYKGTISKPPCTPDVTYLVLSNIKRIQKKDLDSFPADLIDRNRDVHDRENRELVILSLEKSINKTINHEHQKINPLYKEGNSSEDLTIQGFKLSPDIEVKISSKSPYPIVADINEDLPFPKMNIVVSEPTEEQKEGAQVEKEAADKSTRENQAIEVTQEATSYKDKKLKEFEAQVEEKEKKLSEEESKQRTDKWLNEVSDNTFSEM